MVQPPFRHFWWSVFGHCLDNFLHLGQVISPNRSILKQIYVHQLDYHVSDAEMDFAELFVFSDQICSKCLNFAYVVLDLDWVVPGHCAALPAFLPFRILDDEFKIGEFLEHHWLLAINHLGSH